MVVQDSAGWSGLVWGRDWKDHGLIRARLDAGADPHSWVTPEHGPPLHIAAEWGSPEVVAELAGRVDDVDAEYAGRTALWTAVFENRPEVARALVAAGADPWRAMMAGWSPARLSLAGRTPDLFPVVAGAPGLSEAELAVMGECRRLTAVLRDVDGEGLGLACVADIDAAEAVRRLALTPVPDFDLNAFLREYHYDLENEYEVMSIMGVTDVPGGCIISQPWGYGPSMSGVIQLLSKGTICYGFFDNAAKGPTGAIYRDGVVLGWDLWPGGGWVDADASAEEILLTYLYQGEPVAYCCAYAGLRPTDDRAIDGPPDGWFRLPPGDYWS